MADVGTGITVACATSSFTAEYLGVAQDGISRVSIPTSHLGTTTAHTFMPGDLRDEGEFSGEFAFNPNNQPPIGGAAEQITVTFPVPAGSSNGATAVFSGFCTGWNWTGNLEEKMTGNVTFKISGAVTWTDAS